MECDIIKNKTMLPDFFSLNTLNICHLDEIHTLLTNHYTEDIQNITRLVYPRDFLYWYLKQIPSGLNIGLCYQKKLVGFICAIIVDTLLLNKKHKIAYVNFFCIHNKLRHHGLGKYLQREIKNRLINMGITNAVFISQHTSNNTEKNNNYSCKIKEYIIPINHFKLEKIGFLEKNSIDPLPKPHSNDLHLMVVSDIKSIVPKLNKFIEKYHFKPCFNEDNTYIFLLPKKNIVYTFVKRNSNQVTDMITIYKNYVYCKEKNEMIGVGQLTYYFHETLSLTELIVCLIDKLPSYGIDQLIFRDIANNEDINITKFSTYGELRYNFNIDNNMDLSLLKANEIIFFPF